MKASKETIEKVLTKEEKIQDFCSREANLFNDIYGMPKPYPKRAVHFPSQVTSRMWVRFFLFTNTLRAIENVSNEFAELHLELGNLVEKLVKANGEVDRLQPKFYHTLDRLRTSHFDWKEHFSYIPYKKEEIAEEAGRLFSVMEFSRDAMFEGDEEPPINLCQWAELTSKIYQIALGEEIWKS